MENEQNNLHRARILILMAEQQDDSELVDRAYTEYLHYLTKRNVTYLAALLEYKKSRGLKRRILATFLSLKMIEKPCIVTDEFVDRLLSELRICDLWPLVMVSHTPVVADKAMALIDAILDSYEEDLYVRTERDKKINEGLKLNMRRKEYEKY